MTEIFYAAEYGIDNTGKRVVTKELQDLVDKAAKAHGRLILEKGIYLTASVFLKSNMEFHFEDGATLLATTDESQYPVIPTRVAGIEMEWYSGVLNCIGQDNVTISGRGTIDGNGEYWWRKYWGADRQGGMRKDYDRAGLRWACDYDCRRMRNLVIMESTNITIKELTSTRSGFWNVHICYSSYVHVDGIKITACGPESPSTDGIDIDSSAHVLIENCVTSCNDDSICIKSGRDLDGIQVGRPCHDIEIHNCRILSGFGVTIGSEVSGGIYNIILKDVTYDGTDCGFRIKSSLARRGYISNILVDGLEMHNVKYPFHMLLNWNPSYSYCQLPADYKGEIPKHWEKLLAAVPAAIPNTQVDGILIRNVNVWNDEDYDGISRAFHIEGFADQPIRNITFKNIKMACKEFGLINYTEGICFENVRVTVSGAHDRQNDEYDNE